MSPLAIIVIASGALFVLSVAYLAFEVWRAPVVPNEPEPEPAPVDSVQARADAMRELYEALDAVDFDFRARPRVHRRPSGGWVN